MQGSDLVGFAERVLTLLEQGAFVATYKYAVLLAFMDLCVDLQEGRCFYCGSRLGGRCEVDHFIPWARYPNIAVENLVVADGRCNSAKRDFLAAESHVRHWRERNARSPGHLSRLADGLTWETRPDETLGIARGICLRWPPRARLWVREREFCLADRDALGPLLA